MLNRHVTSFCKQTQPREREYESKSSNVSKEEIRKSFTLISVKTTKDKKENILQSTLEYTTNYNTYSFKVVNPRYDINTRNFLQSVNTAYIQKETGNVGQMSYSHNHFCRANKRSTWCITYSEYIYIYIYIYMCVCVCVCVCVASALQHES
jgi:hypothetical protein